MNFLKVNLKIRFKKESKGTFRKKLDTNLAKKYGWVSKIICCGLSITISDYLEQNILKDNQIDN